MNAPSATPTQGWTLGRRGLNEITVPTAAGGKFSGWRSKWSEMDGLAHWATGLFVLQFIAMAVWSAVLYHRFALTTDFAYFQQFWTQLGHGNLDPYTTIFHEPVWRNNGEFILWPLALIPIIFRTGLALLWSQDLATVLAGAVAFLWARELLRNPPRCPRKVQDRLCGLVLLLLIINPWSYWSISFDFHLEPLTTLLAVLAARALWLGHRWSILCWTLLLLLTGAPAAVVVVGVGVGGLLTFARRRLGLALVVLGALWTLGLSSAGGAMGAGLTTSYAYLVGPRTHPLTTTSFLVDLAEHPLRVLSAWWYERHNAFAMVAPLGLLGALAAPSVGVTVLVLLAADLYGTSTSRLFAAIPFQNFPMMPFVAVGTALLLNRAWGYRRLRPGVGVVAAGLASYAVLWSVTWVPQLPGTWLRTSPAAAATLTQLERTIPRRAEIVAWQGVVGRLAGRRWVYAMFEPGYHYPIRTSPVYFVAAPYQGIEAASVADSLRAMGQLAGPMHATLVMQHAGIWLWKWVPPPHTKTVSLLPVSPSLPAWGLDAPGGTPVLAGPAQTWHLSSNGKAGYAASGAYWRLRPGRYAASVTLSTTSPTELQLWDDTDATLMAQRDIPATNGRSLETIDFSLARLHRSHVYSGWGPVGIVAAARLPGDQLEIRIQGSPHQSISIYSLNIVPQGVR